MDREKGMCRQPANDVGDWPRSFNIPLLGRSPAPAAKAKKLPYLFRVARPLVNEGEQVAFCHGTGVQKDILFPHDDDSGKL